MAAERLRLHWVDAHGESRAIEVTRLLRLGRAAECELVLDEEGVSRVHCSVAPDGDTLTLLDLHSTNGTYVNGTRVREARLRGGDTLLLGRLMMRVEAGDRADESFKTCFVGPEEIEVALDSLQAGYPPENLSPESSARHLQALYGILRVIGEAADADSMFLGALRTILDTLPFDFGHLLIGRVPKGGGDPELRAVASHAKSGEPPPHSRTVVRRVLASGQAVLANDVQTEPELKQAKSIVAARSLRIVCAPLPLRGEVGVIYAAAHGIAAPVDGADVAFLNAAARQIGLAAQALRERSALARENELLKRSVPVRALVGGSAPMTRLREIVRRTAEVEATVLITGESGTGKELVARGVHAGSSRATKPFIALNCGALPGHVVQSELFGHEKGAFTGAIARRTGLVELADHGTLFLDEIGELSAEMQVMLLRLLEERRFFRVGGEEEVRVDVRFVAATNRDLDAAAQRGSFRSDLLFRLKVVEIRTPPLRHHLEDLAEIATAQIDEIARTTDRPAKSLGPAALERLARHSWPGNVRELKNALERAVLLGAGPVIEPEELGLAPAPILSMPTTGDTPLVSLEQIERDHVRRVLQATGWNKTRAAEILGVARITLYEKIKLFGLERAES